jgi:type I restriction enzyme S subunit
MMSIRVEWPTPAGQIELESLLGPLLALARNNRGESRDLADMRDALLPELISGRMTVN